MSSPRLRRWGIGVVALATAATPLVATASPAAATSPDVVISEVYGGGGNSGATFTNDFVELYNRGTAAVSLSGWSVQYASASGTSWQLTALSGSIAAGGHYLVQEAQGAGGTEALPTPDATGTIAMSATSGKVALVQSGDKLLCGSACHFAAGVYDFVGYGSANDFEGSAPAPGLSNTTSDSRDAAGTDTDDNAADFRAGAPAPQSSTGSAGGGTGGIDGLRIHDVQGAAQQSPYKGKTVDAVPGVVTALTYNGFWMQDPQADADPATSEGIFVFTNSSPTVSVGDSITVTGKVSEFRPGGSSNANLTTTELEDPSISVVASGQPLPAATLVGPGGRVPPGSIIEDDSASNVETADVFDPAQDGLDFWESMEGMRLEIDDAQVVGPTNQFGETAVVPQGSGVRTDRGGIVAQAGDFNPERVIVADDLVSVPSANVGDTFVGATVGVLDYDFGNFFLLPTQTPVLQSGGLQRESTQPAAPDQLAIATFNVENLSPQDPQSKFDTLADYAVHNLAAPDILALEEIQDNDGATDDGVVAADQTLSKLVNAITAAGGPVYQWREIDPVNDQDGGEPGGNIRVAFLFRTDRGLQFVDRPGGDSTTATQVVDVDGQPQLTLSPGRIDPTNSAWDDSRKPLAGEFRWQGRTVFVIANHFDSKGGDDPLMGRYQPPSEPTAVQRHQQATLVHDFVSQIEGIDPSAAVAVVGDLNDFDFSQTLDTLTAGDILLDLPRTLPLPERYTYVYEGNSEVLDHILLSPGLTGGGHGNLQGAAPAAYDYDIVHVNSEFNDQVSDHDPQVVRLAVHSPVLAGS